MTTVTTTPTLASVSATPAGAVDQEKLKSAAQAFEAVFLRQMISSMRSAGLGDGMFDSQATGQFRDMADAKTADAMAGKGVLGIAGLLEKQLGGVAGAIPQVKMAEAAVGVAGRAAHVVGDLASRFKL